MVHLEFDSLEDMFKGANELALYNPEFCENTRIGHANEVLGLSLRSYSTLDYVFTDERINRISYDYAAVFWDFMISGGTDATTAFEAYPNVAKFMAKPKSDALPENFNTFYGPRIAKQLPMILKELKDKPNTRRATIMILNENDLQLLDKDETLEFPCTIAFNFTQRDGKLIMATAMRSQNLAVVFQLDIYLQIRLLHLIAEELGIDKKNTEYQCYMMNAHLFERDFKYVEGWLDTYIPTA